ncbi:MAG: 3-phosphoshikimate 1-carboxyvinyltransferase [Clostridia bacterium]|nr:3-phosphoshikimate 1-carboxyvinyltransferase [Clostridia bacterium]
MNMKLKPARLGGAITPPPSKSQAHRVLIAAALADGESKLSNLASSQDILATKRCLEALKTPSPELPLLDCGESGSTLRFLLPLSLVLRGGGVFTGQGRLMERPMEPYAAMCAEKGIFLSQKDRLCTVKGTLKAGRFSMAGNVSSQFVTGLLYALPLLEGNSELVLTTRLESRGYADMTLDTLRRFGVRADYDGDRRFSIPGGQRYQPTDVTVEADYSQAAFFCAANAMGNSVEIRNLNPDSVQGDRVILSCYERLSKPGKVVLDVSQCPDLVPALALQAALRDGWVTKLCNAGRLRMKESDRLCSVTSELGRLGADIIQSGDSLVIRGLAGFHGGVAAQSHNDHRIAMMLGIAATRADAPIILMDAGCVAKSYPGFWTDYASLGGQCEEAVP